MKVEETGDSELFEQTTIGNGLSVDIQHDTTGNAGLFGQTTIGNGLSVDIQDDTTGNAGLFGQTTIENGFSVDIQDDTTGNAGLFEQMTTGNGLSVDTQDDTTGNAGLFEQATIGKSLSVDAGLFEQTTIGNGLSVDIQDDTSGNAGLFEQTTLGNDNFNNKDSATDDCRASAAQLSNETFLPSIDNAGDNFSCVFASQDYVNFYRIWIWFNSLWLFVIPVLILIVSNTATWIKVYKMSHGPLINPTSQMIRRTRHVIILTTLISITFILFVSPFLILLVLESETDDDLQYPIFSNENRAVLKLIAECLFICNPTCNFFLYIISGKRFRDSLKAAFCKPKSESQVIAQKPLEMLPVKLAELKTVSGQNAQNG